MRLKCETCKVSPQPLYITNVILSYYLTIVKCEGGRVAMRPAADRFMEVQISPLAQWLI